MTLMNNNDSVSDSARAGRTVGAMFFFGFGGAWLALWAQRTLMTPLPAFIVIGAATAALLIYAYKVYSAHAQAATQKVESPEEQRRSRNFHIVNAGQWVLILIVGNVLANLGQGDWVIPAVIFIVGLHFLPLARNFDNPPHYVTGAALMLLAVVYPLVAANGPRNTIGCLGAGLVLWASAAWALCAAEGCFRSTE